jgi:hypothetical protein
MENLDLEESSDRSLPNSGSEKNFDYISNYSEEDFTARYAAVSQGSKEEWTSGQELHDNELMLSSLGPDYDISTPHQVYVIIGETSKELDVDGNPLDNPANF